MMWMFNSNGDIDYPPKKNCTLPGITTEHGKFNNPIIIDWSSFNVTFLLLDIMRIAVKHFSTFLIGISVSGHGGKTCFHELRQPPLYYCLWLKFILSLAKTYSVASVYVFYKRVYVFL